ncbi:cupin domain-containing protein [Achromobacter aloeverae]
MGKPFEVFRRADAELVFEGGGETGVVLHKRVDETYTNDMGAGFYRVNNAPAVVAALPYDEVAICLEGRLRLTVDGKTHELGVGDFAWIPKGTAITFDGENAVAFYGVYPANWRAASTS